MRKSNKPTGYILIKAHLCSEWDSVDGCIVQVDNEKLHRWNISATKEKELENYEYAHTSYYYNTDWICDDRVDKVLKDNVWCHIAITDDEIEELGKPDQRVDCMMVKMYGEETCCWIGYGKHTSEEFWTETVSITDIMKPISKQVTNQKQ